MRYARREVVWRARRAPTSRVFSNASVVTVPGSTEPSTKKRTSISQGSRSNFETPSSSYLLVTEIFAEGPATGVTSPGQRHGRHNERVSEPCYDNFIRG